MKDRQRPRNKFVYHMRMIEGLCLLSRSGPFGKSWKTTKRSPLVSMFSESFYRSVLGLTGSSRWIGGVTRRFLEPVEMILHRLTVH